MSFIQLVLKLTLSTRKSAGHNSATVISPLSSLITEYPTRTAYAQFRDMLGLARVVFMAIHYSSMVGCSAVSSTNPVSHHAE